MPKLSDADVGRLVSELITEYEPHMARLKVRRLLIDMTTEAWNDNNGTGTNVPEPFDRSKMIIKSMVGEPVKEVQRHSARISSNPPVVNVIPPVVGKEEVTKTVEKQASEQERLLMAMWEAVKGKRLQRQVSWSQCWGRVGWYLTMPRDAEWGLPDRIYYDSLSDDELERMREAGLVTPEPIEGPDGKMKHAESADSWIERRQRAKQQHAASGASLFTLEALPPDIVYPRWDRDVTLGPKYAAVVEEVPATTFAPGSEMAMAAAEHLGYEGEDVAKFGIFMDKENRVQGGVTKGAEPDANTVNAWTFVRLFTRDEVYYLVSGGTGQVSKGKVVWHAEIGDGICPVIPVPFAETDSMRPGGESTSPLEALFAYTPIVNQVMTLLSNVGAFNGIPRFVVEDVDGNLIRDAETGEPKMLSEEQALGLNPKDAAVVGGKVRQLRIEEPGELLNLLQFYAERMDLVRIPDVAVGAAGTSGPAWNVRQQIAQTQIDLQPAVDNHAEAVATVFRIWIRRMRKLGESVMMFSSPGNRGTERSLRGLIEFDPENLVESIQVTQDSNTPSDRIVLQEHGIQLWSAGVIDDRELYEKYFLSADPEEMMLRKDVQRIKAFVLYGDTTEVMPGSVMANVAQAVQGRVTQQMLSESPNFALATAEQMATQSQMQAEAMTQQQLGAPEGGGGNVGLTQPGQGQALTLEQQMPREAVMGV